MISSKVDVGFSLSGKFEGTTLNPDLESLLSYSNNHALLSTGTGATLVNQALDYTKADQTLALSTTLNLDLRAPGAFLNPLGETISVANANTFAKIRVIKFVHLPTSLATSGLQFFNAASNPFQGPMDATKTLTLLPGESFCFESYTTAGWLVDATHSVIKILNLTAAAALYRFFIGGSLT